MLDRTRSSDSPSACLPSFSPLPGGLHRAVRQARRAPSRSMYMRTFLFFFFFFERGLGEPPLACKYGSPTTYQASGACVYRSTSMLIYCGDASSLRPPRPCSSFRGSALRFACARFFCSLAAFRVVTISVWLCVLFSFCSASWTERVVRALVYARTPPPPPPPPSRPNRFNGRRPNLVLLLSANLKLPVRSLSTSSFLTFPQYCFLLLHVEAGLLFSYYGVDKLRTPREGRVVPVCATLMEIRNGTSVVVLYFFFSGDNASGFGTLFRLSYE